MYTALKASGAIIKFLFAGWLLTGALTLNAQEIPFLEKPVTINASNQTIAEVFKSLSQQTGVVFSYNSQQFNDMQKVTVMVNKKPLRTALSAVLKHTSCNYSIKKKYIIIKCEGKKTTSKSTFTINGYLMNAKDSSKITNGSVFIKTTRQSTVSDSFGYFKLLVHPAGEPLHVSFAKENFTDSAIIVSGNSDNELWMFLSPVPAKVVPQMTPTPAPAGDTTTITAPDSVTSEPVVPADTVGTDTLPTSKFWEKQKKLNANLRNIRDTLFSQVNISLFPPISTNKLLSFNTINKFSFNILIGESKGVDGFELGGLLNFDFGNVQYAQLAGLGNVVAGNVKYCQVGGLFNSVLGNIEGVQVGGIYNDTRKGVNGAQIGGIFSMAKAIVGVQVSGIFNIARNVHGAQVGGIFNYTKDSVDALQLGGIFNRAEYIKGLQLAGVFNFSRKTEGMQLSGLVNYSRVMKGVQLSCFNFSDSCSGIPFGIFSYVNKGYHKIETAFDELQIASLAFRSGVDKLHNIFFAGYNGFNAQKLWTYGYGFGSYNKITPRKGILFDLTAQQLQNTDIQEIKLNLLNRLAILYSYSPAKKINIAIGPSLNFLLHDINDDAFNTAFAPVAPHAFANSTEGQFQYRAWVGGKVSLKIL